MAEVTPPCFLSLWVTDWLSDTPRPWVAGATRWSFWCCPQRQQLCEAAAGNHSKTWANSPLKKITTAVLDGVLTLLCLFYTTSALACRQASLKSVALNINTLGAARERKKHFVFSVYITKTFFFHFPWIHMAEKNITFRFCLLEMKDEYFSRCTVDSRQMRSLNCFSSYIIHLLSH